MRELRAMLYAVLATEQEEIVSYPVIVPCREVPWWEMTRVTCNSGTGTAQ